MSLLRDTIIVLLTVCGILGQDFGETIDDSPYLEITAEKREAGPVRVDKFDIYKDEDDGNRITLEILVPVNPAELEENVKNLYIIDFKQYTPNSNPIEDNEIQLDEISNCSNFRYDTPQTLSSQFVDDGSQSTASFFESNLVEDPNQDGYFLKYSYDGLLNQFDNCQMTDPERENVWSVSETKSGKQEHSTVVVMNNVKITRSQEGNTTSYQPAFFSTAFKLSWSISQYIFVNAVIASQKRVEAEVIYASVQPLWESGVVTERTLVQVIVRTTLENAYHSHLMMVFVKDSDSGTFAVLDGDETLQITAQQLPPTNSAQVPCERQRNYLLDQDLGTQSDGYYDCQQNWEFSVILPQNTTVYNEVEGLFVFKLQLYQCDDLSLPDPDCGPVEDMTEQIYATITLDTVVVVTAQQENTLTLEVTAIRSKDNAADFLTSNVLSRGIYHRESVVVYIQPTQHITKTPGADLISQYGLTLSAFIVCLQSQIPLQSRMGCLDVDSQFRYIPFMEENLSVSLHGKMYKRDDFEETKQDLTGHKWDVTEGYYTIEFLNLALSGRSRLYRITMIFRVNYTDESVVEDRGKRSLLMDAPLDFKKREVVVDGGSMISNTETEDEDNLTDNAGNTDSNPESEENPDSEPTNPDGEPTNPDSEPTNPDSEPTNPDSEPTSAEETATADSSIKVDPCPEGFIFVSTDEPCREYSTKNGGNPTVISAFLLYLIVWLII